MNGQDSEVIFVMYEDIIKSFKPYVLQQLLTPKFKSIYEECIDFGKIEGKSYDELMGLVLRSTTPDILEYISRKPFNFGEEYVNLVLNLPDAAKESKLLDIGCSLVILLQQKFIKRIYIYSEYYDDKIHEDIFTTFNNTKLITYVTGDFDETISSLSETVTAFIINDINLIHNITRLNKIEFTNVLVSNVGYNYKLNNDGKLIVKLEDIDELSQKRMFNVSMFNPDTHAVV